MKRGLIAAVLCLSATVGSAQERLIVARGDGAQVPMQVFGGDGAGCAPLLILSHGFGGDEHGLKQLARAAAAEGFRAITIGHRESGRVQLRQVLASPNRRAALARAVIDKAANVARMADLDAAWAYAHRICQPPFTVLAGHSMGAQLTMIEAGAQNVMAVKGRDRFDAYVALSPQGVGPRFPQGAWRSVGKPTLMVTGTRDHGLDGRWRHRLAAFDGLPAGGKWLAVLDGATHRDMSGQGTSESQRNVRAIVLAFAKTMGKPSATDMPRLDGVRYRTK
ncbi:hypothetical protein RXV86_17955 [Alisedimentitalea sp. MJ-SS2]|uniref:alpha/beta hydrolase family protein n=1 Tax=Aliisedimentitalea sp. MJ-SS2 TaxID=3049795 RepID=UPI00290C288F|nr:hypothetical protein [Alisedimentitalea sp. MJ-SS2]MDU8929280.1 hypothetical protein [Alisedimentitalea sp. MJ-SS2]